MERYPRRKRLFLWLGAGGHLVSLAVFKYLPFAAGELSGAFPSMQRFTEITLPVGISFYSFQGISYLADVSRGKVKAERSLLRYGVYIAMFEQLIAGPIVPYGSVVRQLKKRKESDREIFRGLGTFVIGLGLKVLLANPIWKLWMQVQTIGYESISTPLAWMAIAAYSFYLYFDFFGYSLMAMGLGRMLGFRIPANFNHPYLSRSMTEFWRRWHMTLGAWFREYVYIPLGGSRCGRIKTVRNLLIVWLLTGIWHGAGYNYLLWGLVLFLILVTEKRWTGAFLARHRFISHGYMLLLIPLCWAVFAIEEPTQLLLFFGRLFPVFGDAGSVFSRDYLKYLGQYYPFFLVAAAFSTPIPYRLLQHIRSKVVLGVILGTILLACLYCMYRGLNDPFLYFRF